MCITNSWEMTEAEHIIGLLCNRRTAQFDIVLPHRRLKGICQTEPCCLPIWGRGGYVSDLSWPGSTDQSPLDFSYKRTAVILRIVNEIRLQYRDTIMTIL